MVREFIVCLTEQYLARLDNQATFFVLIDFNRYIDICFYSGRCMGVVE